MPSSLSDPRPVVSPLACAVAALLAPCLAGAARAQAPTPPTLEHCATIGTAADRLACYDQLAGRAPAPVVPPAQNPIPGSAAPATPSSSLLVAKDAPVVAPAEAKEPPSLMSKYWELGDDDKRGVFNLVGYRANYVLPMHLTNRINRAPQSPTQDPVAQPGYRQEEAKFQFSMRTKLIQDFGFPGADLWAAFTQQAMWQIWNGEDSKPFRNSDYEPELIYVVPTGKGLRDLPFGWKWRYTQAGLAHQSNGQSDPLSRSWNRVYLAAGFDRGDWGFTARLTERLKENISTDNNPDLVTYRGRGEFQLNWSQGLHTAALLYRTTLKSGRYGAVQFDWTYPIFRDQPNGLRWMVQGFSGYGETLTDYNFRQSSLGLGVAFLQF